jgi:hypothetical protein
MKTGITDPPKALKLPIEFLHILYDGNKIIAFYQGLSIERLEELLPRR